MDDRSNANHPSSQLSQHRDPDAWKHDAADREIARDHAIKRVRHMIQEECLDLDIGRREFIDLLGRDWV